MEASPNSSESQLSTRAVSPPAEAQIELIQDNFGDVARYYLDGWRYLEIGLSTFRVLEYALIEGPGKGRAAAPYSPQLIARYHRMPLSQVYEGLNTAVSNRLLEKSGTKNVGNYLKLKSRGWVTPWKGGEAGHADQAKVVKEIHALAEQLALTLDELEPVLDQETIKQHVSANFPFSGKRKELGVIFRKTESQKTRSQCGPRRRPRPIFRKTEILLMIMIMIRYMIEVS